VTYGPSTPHIATMLEQARNFGPASWKALDEAYELTQGVEEYLLVWMSRDFAWQQFQEALAHTELVDAFERLWTHMRGAWGPSRSGYWPARDAVAATMLTHHVAPEGFTRADYDCLLAPWRAVVDHCVRSRTFLSAAPRWPYPAEGLWEVVDAILATPG
jgi:hypothetical protein